MYETATGILPLRGESCGPNFSTGPQVELELYPRQGSITMPKPKRCPSCRKRLNPDHARQHRLYVLAHRRAVRNYQKRAKQRGGRCYYCGGKLGLSTVVCDKHLMLKRKFERHKGGYHPWKPGGLGSPPLERRGKGLRCRAANLTLLGQKYQQTIGAPTLPPRQCRGGYHLSFSSLVMVSTVPRNVLQLDFRPCKSFHLDGGLTRVRELCVCNRRFDHV